MSLVRIIALALSAIIAADAQHDSCIDGNCEASVSLLQSAFDVLQSEKKEPEAEEKKADLKEPNHTSMQQSQVKHAKSFYKKLRANHIISLNLGENGNHPNQAVHEAMSSAVAAAVDGAMAAQEIKDVEDDINAGDHMAPRQNLTNVTDLGFTKMEKKDVANMFNQLDGDEDGEVTLAELTDFMKMSEIGQAQDKGKGKALEADEYVEYAAQAFKMAGPERAKPKDSINFEEFANFQADLNEYGKATDMAEFPDIAKIVMGDADIGGDGKLSATELSNFMVQTGSVSELPPGYTAQKASDLMMKSFDKNEDGNLNMEELKEMLIEIEVM